MSSRISTADADEGPPRKRVRWQSVADEEARVDDNEEFTDTEETEDPEEESSGSEQVLPFGLSSAIRNSSPARFASP